MFSVLEDATLAALRNPVLFIGLVSGCALAFAGRYLSPWRRLPPGPPGYPFVGNVLQLKKNQWLLFSAWRKVHGDIFYLNAAGQPIVIINRHDIAADLLDRRAGIYSDRPTCIVGCEIMTGGLMFGGARYGDAWRRMRKGAHEAVNKVVARGLNEYQISEALVLARSAIRNPADWDGHLRLAAASLMLTSLYGERPPASAQDSRLSFINDYNEHVTLAMATGAHWVEFLPWMRHIPSRLAACKRSAEARYKSANDEFLRLFGRVLEKIAVGEDQASFCSTLIHESGRSGLNDQENAWLAATMYAAGADTTATAMSWWTLAMVAYPDAQMRAQREIDAVVGRARTPTFADMPHLPYTCAMVKEVLRWRTVAPLAIPHRSIEDDVYEGYFIPKGTVVIANVWELNRDPETYGPDSHQFNPARYLDDSGKLIPGPPGTKDDGHFSFGFGRRVCVGKHVANNSLFIEIAISLWAFTLANVKGQKIDVDAFLDEGVVVRPQPFQVDIQPRFPEAIAILSEECELRGR
ncbi:cytochrome P450 [Peniophora sp. CONT]|nr:cytochrome P450 [Peniophora sp. CONT]